jgi:transposase
VNEMAQLLAQTQGAFLTSIKGIGIVLAAGVTAEIGDPLAQRSTDQLASYAGIVPKVKQTGGSQGASITSHVSKRSNHILKDFVVQSAFHIGRYGPKDCRMISVAVRLPASMLTSGSPVALSVWPCV